MASVASRSSHADLARIERRFVELEAIAQAAEAAADAAEQRLRAQMTPPRARRWTVVGAVLGLAAAAAVAASVADALWVHDRDCRPPQMPAWHVGHLPNPLQVGLRLEDKVP